MAERRNKRTLYAVVHFVKEDSIEVLPYSWLKSDSICLWPAHKNSRDVTKLVRSGKDPENNWKICEIELLFKAMTYDKARTLSIRAEKGSDLQVMPKPNL